jgi:hypothetical protein
MPFRLKSSAFDAARPLLDRIHTRGWIWRGRQELHGLCCVKDWFEGEGWIAALTPWLDRASQLRENESLVLLEFAELVQCDCAELGRMLPLRRADGALSSFAVALSGPSGTLRDALADQLLIIDQGERVMTSLSEFRPIDVADWWWFDGIAAEEGTSTPRKPTPAAHHQSTASSTPFDPEGVEAGLENVRDRILARPSLAESAIALFRGVLGAVARGVVWVFVVSVAASIIIGALTALIGPDGNNREIWKGILIYAATAAIVLFLFRPSKPIGPARGTAGGKAPAGAAPPIALPDNRFGFFRRAAGWLFWNSALASGVRDKYNRRLRELEELFARGELDEALRKAIAMGAPSKRDQAKQRGWFGDFPLSAPGRRKNLNIRFQLGLAPSYGILTEQGFEAIRELYRKQAEALAERGDFERAAFIYAELLNDPAAAVRIFERKGDFETAAKLAQGRRLAPSLFIPLWFKAGDKKRALRLAAQYDAFADLVAHVSDSDPFHKELVIAWSRRLVETGDFARALELTEKYAGSMPQRRLWILGALDRNRPDADLLARALRCLPEEHPDRLKALFDGFVTASGPDDIAARVRLAARMSDAQFEKAATAENYFPTLLPLWGLPLLRALLQDEVRHGSDKDRREAALALSEASGQHALRVDLRRLNRVTAQAAAPPTRHIIMNDARGLAPVREAICVPGNRLLIAYESGALHLTTLEGRRVWADQIHNFKGFAPIRAGNTIIIVRQEIEGAALSLLDLDNRTHKDIGPFGVEAFARQASEIGWMVFAGGRVLMLDISSLIAAAKSGGTGLEHHWAVPITEPGRVRAFRDHSEQASFLFHRKLGGLLELWTLQKSTLKVDCRFITKGEYKLSADIQTYGWPGGSHFHARSEDGARIETLIMPTMDYSLAAERLMLAEAKGWLLPQQGLSVAPSGGMSLTWCSAKTGSRTASVPATSGTPATTMVKWFGAPLNALQNPFTVEFPRAGQVSARIGASSLATVFDDIGRIAVIDFQHDKLLFRNDGK